MLPAVTQANAPTTTKSAAAVTITAPAKITVVVAVRVVPAKNAPAGGIVVIAAIHAFLVAPLASLLAAFLAGGLPIISLVSVLHRCALQTVNRVGNEHVFGRAFVKARVLIGCQGGRLRQGVSTAKAYC